uniref:Uncharacterized protein n=1 Tax=Schistosoma haematobium TaxID=6185 RepID=A0A095AP17_SCHHA
MEHIRVTCPGCSPPPPFTHRPTPLTYIQESIIIPHHKQRQQQQHRYVIMLFIQIKVANVSIVNTTDEDDDDDNHINIECEKLKQNTMSLLTEYLPTCIEPDIQKNDLH